MLENSLAAFGWFSLFQRKWGHFRSKHTNNILRESEGKYYVCSNGTNSIIASKQQTGICFGKGENFRCWIEFEFIFHQTRIEFLCRLRDFVRNKIIFSKETNCNKDKQALSRSKKLLRAIWCCSDNIKLLDLISVTDLWENKFFKVKRQRADKKQAVRKFIVVYENFMWKVLCFFLVLKFKSK